MEWDLSKENVQPTKSGRNAEVLNDALKSKLEGSSRLRIFEHQRRKMLEAIDNYIGDDPLQPWIEYIKWVKDAFPSGGAQSQLIEILEACTRTFLKSELYRADVRYLKVWVQYADCCTDPREIFAFLEANNIGLESALFYEAYATCMEVRRNFLRVDEIYKLGIARQAQPLRRLENMHKSFLLRMVKRIERQHHEGSVGGSVVDTEFNQQARLTLGVVDENGSTNWQTGDTHGRQADIARGRQNPNPAPKSRVVNRGKSTSFPVLVDPEFEGLPRVASSERENADSVQWAHLSTETQMRKENVQRPSKWNDAKISLKSSLDLSSKPALGVFVDDEFAGNSDKKGPSATQNLSGRLLLSQINEDMPAGFLSQLKQRSEKMPVQIILAYDDNSLSRDGGDMCFEELRLERWTQLQNSCSSPDEIAVGNINVKTVNGPAVIEHFEGLDIKQSNFSFDRARRLSRESHTSSETKLLLLQPSTISTENAQEINICNFQVCSRIDATENTLQQTRDDTLTAKESNTSCEEKNVQHKFDTQRSISTLKCLPIPGVSIEDIPEKMLSKNCAQGCLSDAECIEQPKAEVVKEVSPTDLCVFTEVMESKVNGSPGVERQNAAGPVLEVFISEETSLASGFQNYAQVLLPETSLLCELMDDSLLMPNDRGQTFVIPGDETVAINRFAEQAVGSGPDLNVGSNEAPLHQGLVEPTINTKDALADILSMFNEPLPCDMARRTKKRISKDLKKSDNIPKMKSFQIFVDESLQKPSNSFQKLGDVKAGERKAPQTSIDTGRDLELEEIWSTQTSCAASLKRQLHITEDKENVNISCSLAPTVTADVSHQPSNAEQNDTPRKQAENKDSNPNPWDACLVSSFLEHLTPCLSSYQGYQFNNYSYAGSTLRKKSTRNEIIQLGVNAYELRKCIGQGAFAEVYQAEDVDDDFSEGPADVAIKFQKPACPWEFYIYRQLDKRISKELRMYFGHARLMHIYSDCSFLVCNYTDKGTLQDVVNAYIAMGQRMDEVLCMFYAIEMLCMLEVLHETGIIHGDFKPDNLLIRDGGEDLEDWAPNRPGCWANQGLCLIDWGRSIDTTLFPSNTHFRGDCQTDGFRCVEMLEGRPWTFQVDTFGLCAVIHCLLHGGYMEVEKVKVSYGQFLFRPKAPYKRYWQADLWRALFETLLNIETCQHNPSLITLRRSFENYLVCKKLGKKLKGLVAKQNIMMFTRR